MPHGRRSLDHEPSQVHSFSLRGPLLVFELNKVVLRLVTSEALQPKPSRDGLAITGHNDWLFVLVRFDLLRNKACAG